MAELEFGNVREGKSWMEMLIVAGKFSILQARVVIDRCGTRIRIPLPDEKKGERNGRIYARVPSNLRNKLRISSCGIKVSLLQDTPFIAKYNSCRVTGGKRWNLNFRGNGFRPKGFFV